MALLEANGITGKDATTCCTAFTLALASERVHNSLPAFIDGKFIGIDLLSELLKVFKRACNALGIDWWKFVADRFGADAMRAVIIMSN